MAHNQHNYDTKYKMQAVKLSQKIGVAKATPEPGICVDTLYGRCKAAIEGRLDTGPGSHAPETAIGPAEESAVLRRQAKELDREIRRLRWKTSFWRKPALFPPPAVESQQESGNDISCIKDRRQQKKETLILLQDAESKPTGIL